MASNAPCLEDIALPGHKDRPDMSIRDREWLVHPRSRQTVAKLWALLQEAPRTVCGGYGFLSSADLEDVGIPEQLVSHWRTIDYTDAGDRIEQIPGGMIARDLELLGLGREAVEQGTVVPPAQRKAISSRAATPARPATPVAPLVIRRRGEGVARGG